MCLMLDRIPAELFTSHQLHMCPPRILVSCIRPPPSCVRSTHPNPWQRCLALFKTSLPTAIPLNVGQTGVCIHHTRFSFSTTHPEQRVCLLRDVHLPASRSLVKSGSSVHNTVGIHCRHVSPRKEEWCRVATQGKVGGRTPSFTIWLTPFARVGPLSTQKRT